RPAPPSVATGTAWTRDRHPRARRSSRRASRPSLASYASSVERRPEDQLEQSREIVVRVKREVDLSFALGPQGDAHIGAQAAPQRVFEATYFGRDPYPAFHP